MCAASVVDFSLGKTAPLKERVSLRIRGYVDSPQAVWYYFYGSAGVPNGLESQPYILRSPAWMPDERHRWEKIEAPPDPGAEITGIVRGQANARMVRDLLDASDQKRDPVCSARDGRWSVEMVLSIYQSQKTGARVEFPLKDRRHPLDPL